MGRRSDRRPRRDRELARIASDQIQLITAANALAVGFTRSGIDKRIGRGRLHPLHPGVYATHPPPHSIEQRSLAAVLACGTGALLSDWPAARHLKVVPSSERPALLPVHVTVPPGNGSRSRRGIVVHRRGPINARDAQVRESIPITAPELLLVHLAPSVELPVLEQLLVAAESWRRLSRRRLAQLVAERAGRPGIWKLEVLLRLRPRRARSDLELLVLPVIRASGVPMPLFNHPIDVGDGSRIEVDLAWPDLRLAVELDSQRFHGDWEQAEIDRERDQVLALIDWRSHRFVRRTLANDVIGSGRRLRALVEARVRELGSGSAVAGSP